MHLKSSLLLGGDEFANGASRNFDLLVPEYLCQTSEYNEQFHQRCRACTIQDNQELLSSLNLQVFQECAQHQFRCFIGTLQLHAPCAGLTMLPHTNFHFVVAETENSVAGRRMGCGFHSHS